MWYKLVLQDDGKYVDASGERKELIACNEAITPEGLNVGFTEFENDEAAMSFFQIKLIKNEIDTRFP